MREGAAGARNGGYDAVHTRDFIEKLPIDMSAFGRRFDYKRTHSKEGGEDDACLEVCAAEKCVERA